MDIRHLGLRSVVVVAAAGVLLGGSLAYATVVGHAPLATWSHAAGTSINVVKVVRDSNIRNTSSTTYKSLPGASVTIKIPAGSKGLIIARFSGTSECTEPSNTTGGYGCQVRVLIGGQEAQPTGINASIFDSSSTDGREAHAIERSRGPLGPGTYQVVAQWAVPSATVDFTLANWNLEVDLVKA